MFLNSTLLPVWFYTMGDKIVKNGLFSSSEGYSISWRRLCLVGLPFYICWTRCCCNRWPTCFQFTEVSCSVFRTLTVDDNFTVSRPITAHTTCFARIRGTVVYKQQPTSRVTVLCNKTSIWITTYRSYFFLRMSSAMLVAGSTAESFWRIFSSKFGNLGLLSRIK